MALPIIQIYDLETGETTTREMNDAEYAELLASQQKTPEQIQSEIVAATQKRLDDFAKTRNYDSILSACTYAADLNPKFATEGQYCVDARGATWTKLLEMLAEVEAGTRPMPSGYVAIEPELPPLVWPN